MASWFGRRAAPAPQAPAADTRGAATGVPLELISYDQNTGQFRLGEQAIRALQQTRGPVGVVAVCGRARQGKSFILNQLLGRSGGFVVAPTHRPCTKGLWMWSAPVERHSPDGSKYSLVLLDTEGIDAYDQTGQYSTQIFSLAVLLSSLFVFNQMGGIDEAALDRLSLVTEMTKHVRVRAAGSSGGEEDSAELATFTPAFLWLLRDFYLRLEEEGRQVSPRDYLETALQPLQGTGRAVESKNQIRESIKALFPDRDCFTLVRPVTDEEQLAELDSMPTASMRPEFRDGLQRLTHLIFSKAQPKRLGSQILNGPMLAGLAQAYVDAINNGAVPTIATAWQGVAESESRRAGDAACAAYAAAFSEDVPSEEAALVAEHQHALLAAKQAFDEIAIGDEGVRRANEQRWRDSCEARFQQLQDRKLAQAAAACEKLLNDATMQLAAMARGDGVTVEQLQQAAAAFKAEYAASPAASGPTKWPRFTELFNEAYLGAVRDVTSRQEERRRVEAAAAAQAAEVAVYRAQQAEQRMASAEAEGAQLRARLADVEGQLREAQVALVRERVAAAAAATRLEQQVQRLKQSKEAEGRNLTQQAEAALRAAHATNEAQAAQLRGAQEQSERVAADAQQRLAAAEAEVQSLRQQLAAGGAAAQDWSGRVGALEADQQALQGSVQLLRNEKSELQRSREGLETQLAQLRQQMQVREGDWAAQLRAKEEEARLAAQQAAAAHAAAPAPHAAAAAAAADGDVGMGFGGDDDDDFEDPENLPDPKKMTVAQIKDWLMEHGHEKAAWDLAQKRSKKAEYEALMRQVLGA
ncbi:Guanylate-binding protein 5 [Chlorella vulgaris]